jgi:hypothetical protein
VTALRKYMRSRRHNSIERSTSPFSFAQPSGGKTFQIDLNTRLRQTEVGESRASGQKCHACQSEKRGAMPRLPASTLSFVRKSYLVSFASLAGFDALTFAGAFLVDLDTFTLAFLVGAGAASVVLAAVGAGLDAGFAAKAGNVDAAIMVAIISDDNFDMA